MSAIELLRYNWKPSVLRLLLAALRDAGPVALRIWSVRSGVPRNHLVPALRQAEQLRAVAVRSSAEGLALLVRPASSWRERPLCSDAEWMSAWRVTGKDQEKLDLVTEAPGIAEVMVQALDDSAIAGNRIPVVQPDSGCPTGFRLSDRIPVVPPHPPLNVQRLTLKRSLPDQEKHLEALNVERLTQPESGWPTGIRLPAERMGWMEPETEAEAMAACALLLGGAEEMRAWGGRWRNRWRANPAGLRKILNMVREDQAVGRKPKAGSNWGRYGSDLWDRFAAASQTMTQP